MNADIVCPNCQAKLRVAVERLRSKQMCPKCETVFMAGQEHIDPGFAKPTMNVNESADDILGDDDWEVEPDSEEKGSPAKPTKPKGTSKAAKKRKRKEREQAEQRQKWMLIGGAVAGGLVVFGLFIWFVTFLFQPTPAAIIPDDQWKLYESPNRFSIEFPGNATASNQTVAGVGFTQTTCQPNMDSYFAVGHINGRLPAHRAAMSDEELLTDSCNGSAANVPGSTEVSRKNIKLGEYPGKELVMKVPELKGKGILRFYLGPGRRLFIVMAVGKNFVPGDPNTTRYFDSFKITEKLNAIQPDMANRGPNNPPEKPPEKPFDPKEPFPQQDWRAAESGNRWTALLPQHSQLEIQQLLGGPASVQVCRPHKDCLYTITFLNDLLPEDKRATDNQQLLKESCDKWIADNKGSTEVSRTDLKLGEYVGKELVVQHPEEQGKSVVRLYLGPEKRLYLVTARAKEYDPENVNVKKFFDSFKINEIPLITKLVLPDMPEPLEITPFTSKAETSYKLPANLSSVRVGGGGRFLILHFATLRKLGIFDVSAGKITHYITLAEDDVVYAGGMKIVMVYLPGAGLLQRYNLLTGEREAMKKMEWGTSKPIAFCMGHASAGPLVVNVEKLGPTLYHPDTMKEILMPNDNPQGGGGMLRKMSGALFWAGSSGRLLGSTGNYGMPNGIIATKLQATPQTASQHEGTWFVMPGSDDHHLFVAGHGIVSDLVQPVANVAFSMGPNKGYASHLYLPATSGPYYFLANTIDGATKDVAVEFFALGNKNPIFKLPKTAVCRYGWEAMKGLGIEYSMHLIPQAKVFIVVPSERDRLQLYPVDLESAIAKGEMTSLLVTSRPPTTFQAGKPLTYQVTLQGAKGAVTYKLESGPQGMSLSPTGKLSWTVPAKWKDKRIDVIIAIKDSEGNETFHSFTMNLADAKK